MPLDSVYNFASNGISERKLRFLFLIALALVPVAVFYGEHAAIPLIYSTGLVAAFIGTIFAFNRKRREAALVHDDAGHYQRIFSMLPAAIYTTDAAGRITFYNEAAAKLWGRHPVIGQDEWCGSWRIYAPDGTPVPLDQCPMAVALKENRPVRGIEAVVERPDGIRIPFMPYPTPIRDEAGRLVGAVNMLVDISERKRAETALERRNKFLKLLSETSAGLAEATDTEQMMHMLYEQIFKPIGADIFFNYGVAGEGENAHLVLRAADGVDEETRAAFSRLEFKEAICGPPTEAQDDIIIINDLQQNKDSKTAGLRRLGLRTYICQPLVVGHELVGTLSFGSLTKTCFDPDEIEFIKTAGHYIGIAKKRLRDLNRLKTSEAEARTLAKRAESANTAKTQFLANMSHEIRTPMNVIVGLSNLLESQAVSPEKQGDVLRTLKLSAQQLMELINDVLDLSKIESENLSLEQVPFTLDKILAEIICIQNVRAAEKGISLTLDSARTPECELVGDPLRLKQVLMNLVSNAVKFTEKGQVKLCVDCKPSRDGTEALLRIDVIDTGIGINESQLNKIFDNFTQADASTTRKYGGTGLGLAISKKLMEAMGGKIEVSSTYNEGSCFSIVLSLPIMQETDGTGLLISSETEKLIEQVFGSLTPRLGEELH